MFINKINIKFNLLLYLYKSKYLPILSLSQKYMQKHVNLVKSNLQSISCLYIILSLNYTLNLFCATGARKVALYAHVGILERAPFPRTGHTKYSNQHVRVINRPIVRIVTRGEAECDKLPHSRPIYDFPHLLANILFYALKVCVIYVRFYIMYTF